MRISRENLPTQRVQFAGKKSKRTIQPLIGYVCPAIITFVKPVSSA